MKQIKRTILFDAINREKPCLFDYIHNEDISVNDAIQQKVEKELICSSWQEVLEKFEPHIYILMNTDELKVNTAFSIDEKINSEYKEVYKIRLNEDKDFIPKYIQSSVQALIDSMLMPDMMDDFISDRNALIQSFVSGDEKSALKQLQKMVDIYNNSLFLLYYFIISYKNNSIKKNLKYVHKWDDKDYQIEIVEQAMQPQICSIKMISNQQVHYDKFLNSFFDNRDESNSGLWRYCLKLGYDEIFAEQHIHEVYRSYLDYYMRIVKVFWRETKPLIEKLSGIYYYFEDNHKNNSVPQKILITNLQAEESVEVINRKKLQLYLEYCNEKKYLDNVIWFAIVPTIERQKQKVDRLHHKRFLGNHEEIQRNFNSQSSVKELLNILAEKKIQTFLSCDGEFKQEGLYILETEAEEWFVDLSKIIDRENALYTYPCFPNFVHIPKKHALYRLEDKVIYLEGVSVEASYIAAKIASVSIDMDLIFYDGSVPKLNFVAYEESIIKRFDDKWYGILFEPLNGITTVKCADSAKVLWEQRSTLREVYIMSYVERILRLETDDFKEKLIHSFFQKKRGSIYEQWMNVQAEGNALFRKGEKVTYSIKDGECKLKFEFNGYENEVKVRIIKGMEK